MAPNTRPSRLLNLKNSSTANRTISTHNATNSPFLRLPVELRYRIYELALGRNMIHIDDTSACMNPSTTYATVCLFSPADYHPEPQQHLRDTRLHPALDLRPTKHSSIQHKSTHFDCYHSPLRPRLALHFLQVCRQVYGEAALIPFTSNFFVTAMRLKRSPLRAFLATLVPAQVRAITQLFMGVELNHYNWSPKYIGMLKLEGLRSLHLVLPEWFYYSPPLPMVQIRRCLDFHDIGSLSKLDLNSVEFSFMFTGGRHTSITLEAVKEIGMTVERHKKEILDDPQVYLARKQAEQEKADLERIARRTSVHSTRGFPATSTS